MLLALVSIGCFTPEDDPLVVDRLDFANPYTTSEAVVLQPIEYGGLSCPDGAPSTAYAVYRTDLDAPAPMVLVLHPGSFDYVVDPVPEDPLFGSHYAGEDRLTADWANRKVFETMGLLDAESEDTSLGTVAAALADAGTFALYPANCWGDLWHNEQGYAVNAEEDAFYRNGRALAWSLLGMASPDATTAAGWRAALGLETFPIEVDTATVGIVGLGEGGRGAMELARRAQRVASVTGSSSALPPLRGVVVDSTCDNYYPVSTDTARYPAEIEGLSRIYPGEADIGWYSYQRYLQDTGLPGQSFQVYWSSNDPEVPASCMEGLQIQYANNRFGDAFLLVDTGRPEHGYLNGDLDAARAAVNRMLGRP